MSYRPPTHLLEVLQKIQYEEALPADDPRYVETQAARGSEQTFSRLAKKLGWDPASNAFFAPSQSHVLFFGHVGSGKTTELTRIIREAIECGECRAEAIIATTFTNKAAGELVERVRRCLFEAGQVIEAQRLDESLLGTVHSICARVLGRLRDFWDLMSLRSMSRSD